MHYCHLPSAKDKKTHDRSPLEPGEFGRGSNGSIGTGVMSIRKGSVEDQ
jgi:hypothetical protein